MIRYVRPKKMDQNIIAIYKHALKHKKKLKSIKFSSGGIIEVVLKHDGYEASVLLYPSERVVGGPRHGNYLSEPKSMMEKLKGWLKND